MCWLVTNENRAFPVLWRFVSHLTRLHPQLSAPAKNHHFLQPHLPEHFSPGCLQQGVLLGFLANMNTLQTKRGIVELFHKHEERISIDFLYERGEAILGKIHLDLPGSQIWTRLQDVTIGLHQLCNTNLWRVNVVENLGWLKCWFAWDSVENDRQKKTEVNPQKPEVLMQTGRWWFSFSRGCILRFHVNLQGSTPKGLTILVICTGVILYYQPFFNDMLKGICFRNDHSCIPPIYQFMGNSMTLVCIGAIHRFPNGGG